MTLRPEPYEQFVDDGVFDALDRLRAEADALGVYDGGARVRLGARAAVDGAVCGPNRASQLDADLRRARPHPVAGRPRPRRLFFLMTVRILDEHDVRRLLPMDECIDVMADALAALARGEVHNPLRFVVRPPGEASLMGLMPAHRGGDSPLYALKAVAIFPGNSARGLDSHQGFVALFDGETGATQGAPQRGRDHRCSHRRRVRRRDEAAGARRRAHARDPGHRHPGPVAPRRDAGGARLRPGGRLEPHAGPDRGRRRGGLGRGGGTGCGCGRHGDLRRRADHRARVAEARRAHQRRRLEHSDDPRARHGDDARRGALRRPARVDGQRGG